MEKFIELALGYPTIVFTTLTAAAVLYWSIVLSGILNHDWLGSHHGEIGHDHGDSAHKHIPNVDSKESGAFKQLHGFLNFGQIPIAIVLTIAIGIAWTGSMLLSRFMPGGVVVGTLLCASMGVLGLIGSGIVTRPMRRFFDHQTEHGQHSLQDRICTILSSKVDAQFGQAEVKTKGSPILLNVRCEKSNQLTKGSHAVIIQYDCERDLYHVIEFNAGDPLASRAKPEPKEFRKPPVELEPADHSQEEQNSIPPPASISE